MIQRVAILLVFLLIFINPGFSQVDPPSSPENAVVYFLRGSNRKPFDLSFLVSPLGGYLPSSPSSMAGNLTGFCLYDSTIYIGKLYVHEYIRHECKAGCHLFCAEGKRNEFLKAELEAGKIYFIDVNAVVGEKSADFRPIHPENEFWIDGIISFISNQSDQRLAEDQLQKQQKRKLSKITKSLRRYHEDLAKGRIFTTLEKDMYYRPPESMEIDLE